MRYLKNREESLCDVSHHDYHVWLARMPVPRFPVNHCKPGAGACFNREVGFDHSGGSAAKKRPGRRTLKARTPHNVPKSKRVLRANPTAGCAARQCQKGEARQFSFCQSVKPITSEEENSRTRMRAIFGSSRATIYFPAIVSSASLIVGE